MSLAMAGLRMPRVVIDESEYVRNPIPIFAMILRG